MKTIKFAYAALAILFVQGCNIHSQSKGQEINASIVVDKELCTLYKKDSNTIRTLRALQKPNDSVALFLMDLDVSKPEGTLQKFISVQLLSRKQFEQQAIKFKEVYTWKPFTGSEVIFVQIKAGDTNEFVVLDKRQEIEDQINEALKDGNIGEWIAGDIGPGGGNMLFEVNNIDKSMPVILEVLRQNKVEKQVVIGRRVMVNSNDWFYTVIYPAGFSGIFNTM